MDPEAPEIVRAANLALTRDPALASVLSTLLEYVGRLVHYDTANVMLLDKDGKLRVRAHRGYEKWTDPANLLRLELDPHELGHIREVLTTGRSYVVEDTAAHPGWNTFPDTAYIRSWMGVPLIAGGEVIGIYSLDRSVPHFFTAQSRELTEALAPQAAIAIRNARLYEQVLSHAAKLENEIAERHRVEEALRASEERFRLVAETAHDGILVADARGHVTYANAAACRLLGYSVDELHGRPLVDLVPGRFQDPHTEAYEKHLRTSAASPAGTMFELAALTKTGVEVPVEVSAAVWQGPEGPVFTGILRDVTERHRLLAELRDLSLRDPLTGFYNRRGFATLAEQQLKLCVRGSSGALVAFIDVDGFKLINDNLGHDEGDRALLRIAEALRRTFRASDVVARFGGDEFVVLAVSADSPEAISARLRENVAAVEAEARSPYVLELSIGMCPFDPHAPSSVGALVAAADQAMYAAKNSRHSR